ncbi:hypothetical protein F53441_1395 [Fusarium austroafricanum]|uniref:Zn(2)-C6 fungal-type domain-containing protein n=1 Tax=Fusarium austroafricanum TaxID=2364996 RepID=A0A8H4KUN9_9HYPO|nr:hypothetical protein F53441_1395 [Fusarium austroafricanum]
MASGASATKSGILARYACDYCKQKKFRCSKELPKCSACQPWPGPCNYSREKPAAKPERTIHPSSTLAGQETTDGIHQRLEKVENAVQALTDTVNRALEAMNQAAATPRDNVPSVDKVHTIDKTDQAPKLFVGNSNSFSFVKDTSASIGPSPQDSSLHQHAMNELQYLSTSLTTAVTDRQRSKSSFYIPSRAEGYQLIGRFLEHASLGDAFFITPSEELLIRIMFTPESISRRAWVVYVNYAILALLSNEETAKAEKFRHNMKLALNDSSIFLEPHDINLQTLILLAVHGEDYASPNLSWMLVGHACRQAEALGLHAPSSSDFKTYQRKLSLFWMLFAIDKSCSLAFGRPCFLPSSTYSHVPLPDLGYLTRYQAHSDSPATDGEIKTSMFGAHMFLAQMELSKMMGNIVDVLNRGYVDITGEQLRNKLGEWHTRTNKTLKDIMESERSFSSPNQVREMTIGISTTNFEYLHILMVLCKSEPSSANLRLEAAREAISLLPSMVSNWKSVYNGIIWHLLYFPFIPYFIIFENLICNHASLSATTAQNDINLLSMTVSYFSSMQGQLQILAPMCTRLEKIASVFLRLAQMHVARPDTLGVAPTCRQTVSGHGNQAGEVTSTIPIQQMQMELGEGAGVDLEHYLEWLPADVLPTDTGHLTEVQPETLGQGSYNSSFKESMRPESRGLKRPFDVMFDWFAWDVYYADNK